MSLPLQAIDRLFARLQATYGRDFMERYIGLEAGAVKASWAHELSGFANDMHSLAWALEHLPERPPNVIEFRKIARQAPSPSGRDPALQKIDNDARITTPPSLATLEIMARLRLGKSAA